MTGRVHDIAESRRMRIQLPYLTVLFLVAAFGPRPTASVGAQSTGIVAEINAIEQKWVEASAKPDLAKVEAFLAPEYLHTTIHGQVYDLDLWMKGRGTRSPSNSRFRGARAVRS
jgi:hypothetical protein